MASLESTVRNGLETKSQNLSNIPIADWLFGYQKRWLRLDIIAGLTTSAVVIPKAMAYATIAGLPVEVGLYTAFIPMVIYAVLGSSRPLSVSTTTTLAILTAAELGNVVPEVMRGPRQHLRRVEVKELGRVGQNHQRFCRAGSGRQIVAGFDQLQDAGVIG